MKKIVVAFLVTLTICTISGCSIIKTVEKPIKTETEMSEQIETEAPNLKYQKTKNPVVVSPIEEFIYNPSEHAGIYYGGKLYGKFWINRTSILGIWDWYNSKAVNLGINSSYAMNCGLSVDELLETNNTAVITADISIVDPSGNPLSEHCNVGWSGFPEIAEFYGTTASRSIEIGIQPISLAIDSTSKICVTLADKESGIVFDPIYFSIDTIQNATQGQKLHVIDDAVKVKSINGASYNIDFSLAELNERKRSNGKSAVVYDLKYGIQYRRRPQNDRVVSIFDSFDDDKISPNLSFYVQGDNDPAKLYDVVEDALEFTTKANSFQYVSTKRSFARGEGYIYRTNRKIEDGILPAMDYIRVVVEFPEERAARTDEEMLDFNARYLVYQLKLTEHVAPLDEDIFGK